EPTLTFAGRVLVVEDNEVNLKIAVHLCRKLGVKPDVATSGEEALEKTARDAYDLLILDCQMPGTDGYAVSRTLRARRGHQPIILALTASAMAGDRELCLAAGMDDYITKPVTLGALRSVLTRHAATGREGLDERDLP